MSAALTLFRMVLDRFALLPCWAMYLILLALSMGAWYLVVRVCVNIVRNMT